MPGQSGRRQAASQPGEALAGLQHCGGAMTESPLKVCIVGSGNWGSAIAKIIGNNVMKLQKFASTVKMWVFEETVNGRKLTDIINNDHENVKYLPGHKLPENVVRFGGRKLTKKFRFSHYILWKNQNEPFGQPHSFGSF